ncbi:hypothetical protein K3495_g5800 [Podosphaera aphanis]|nr:hypothetical protein K3495_g5800 [Podosphaera aphanis]
MNEFLDAEAHKLQQRITEARLIISRFCRLLDEITDKELRRETENAAADLKDQIGDILAGRHGRLVSTNLSAANTKPTRAQQPVVPRVAQPRAQRQPPKASYAPAKIPPSTPAARRARAKAEPLAETSKERPWTEVSRKQATKPKQTPLAPPKTTSRPPGQTTKRAKRTDAARPDERLFLRLHEARNRLLEEVHCLESDVGEVDGTTHGDPDAGPLTQGLKLEAASKWILILAPNVPDRLHSVGNSTVPMKPGETARLDHIAIPVTKEMVMKEATLNAGVTPILARVLASNIDRPASDWVIHFPSSSPKLGERLFEESGRLTIFHRKPRIAQCNRYWGYHPTKICSRAERYTRCGSLKQKLDACKQEISRCINCHGPHRADDPSYMARPDRANGKIIPRANDQLTVIRLRGQKDRDHNSPGLTNHPTITFLRANLGKGGSSNNIILQAAWDAGTDVPLIQEPWALRNHDIWLMRSHSGFDRHSPNNGGTNAPRPRSIIYTRKGRATQQIFLCGTSPDFAAVVIEYVTFVSIYRAPGVALPPLLSWNPTAPTIIGGDFNSVHPEWQPFVGRSHGDGHILIEWMFEHGMTLASSPGVPTHAWGNTLDLVWSNTGAIADVAPDLDSTLDHKTLSGDVPRPNAKGAATIRLNNPIRVSDDALDEFTKVVREWSRDLGKQEIRTASDVDNLGNDLVEILSDAIKATGKRSSPQPGQSAPWWTDECRETKGVYRALGNQANKKASRQAVKMAKSQYWRRATAALAAEAAQREVDTILARAERNAMAFDPAKVEVLYFLGSRARNTDLLPITFRDVAIRDCWMAESVPGQTAYLPQPCRRMDKENHPSCPAPSPTHQVHAGTFTGTSDHYHPHSSNANRP